MTDRVFKTKINRYRAKIASTNYTIYRSVLTSDALENMAKTECVPVFMNFGPNPIGFAENFKLVDNVLSCDVVIELPTDVDITKLFAVPEVKSTPEGIIKGRNHTTITNATIFSVGITEYPADKSLTHIERSEDEIQT